MQLVNSHWQAVFKRENDTMCWPSLNTHTSGNIPSSSSLSRCLNLSHIQKGYTKYVHYNKTWNEMKLTISNRQLYYTVKLNAQLLQCWSVSWLVYTLTSLSTYIVFHCAFNVMINEVTTWGNTTKITANS